MRRQSVSATPLLRELAHLACGQPVAAAVNRSTTPRRAHSRLDLNPFPALRCPSGGWLIYSESGKLVFKFRICYSPFFYTEVLKVKKLLTLILWFAAWLSCAALAQTWALYAPPERDFRVVFPGVPSRLVTPAGSVEYRFGDSQYTYSVFRHDPRRASSINAARSDIIQRISGDDQRVQDLGEEQNYTNPVTVQPEGLVH